MSFRLDFAFEQSYHLPDEPVYRGSFSEIYKAMDLKCKRTVAVKVLDTRRFAKGSCEKEVTMLCKVNEWTTNVPEIYCWHTDRESGKLYIIMQWIPGKTLRAHMDETPRHPRGIAWMKELCGILIPLHRLAYQHRDLKPENIQISPHGHVYLMDFNISLEKPTLPGGTQDYAAPEMMAYYNTIGSRQVDIFATGVILYELLTGTKPRHGVAYAAGSDSKAWSRFTQPREVHPALPQQLNDIVVRCMEMDPGKRFPDAGGLLRALREAEYAMKKRR